MLDRQGKRIRRLFPAKYSAGFVRVRSVLDRDPSSPYTAAAKARSMRESLQPKSMEEFIRQVSRSGVPWVGKERLGGVDKFNSVVILDDILVSIRLFFCGTEWFFVSEDKKKQELQRSVLYPSRDKAMSRLSQRRITWLHFGLELPARRNSG